MFDILLQLDNLHGIVNTSNNNYAADKMKKYITKFLCGNIVVCDDLWYKLPNIFFVNLTDISKLNSKLKEIADFGRNITVIITNSQMFNHVIDHAGINSIHVIKYRADLSCSDFISQNAICDYHFRKFSSMETIKEQKLWLITYHRNINNDELEYLRILNDATRHRRLGPRMLKFKLRANSKNILPILTTRQTTNSSIDIADPNIFHCIAGEILSRSDFVVKTHKDNLYLKNIDLCLWRVKSRNRVNILTNEIFAHSVDIYDELPDIITRASLFAHIIADLCGYSANKVIIHTTDSYISPQNINAAVAQAKKEPWLFPQVYIEYTPGGEIHFRTSKIKSV